jgi:hypothetical protein
MGDCTAILERLVTRFGKADGESSRIFEEDEKGRVAHFAWTFGEVDRLVEMDVWTTCAMVTFFDTNAQLAARNRKKLKADLGF